jgi:hypothetical protein
MKFLAYEKVQGVLHRVHVVNGPYQSCTSSVFLHVCTHLDTSMLVDVSSAL